MYLCELKAWEDEEFFGLDGDGLCEGEELYEGELDKNAQQILRARRSVLASENSGSDSATALEEGANMSDELINTEGRDPLGECNGVDGDGLGDGEVAYEGELTWSFSRRGVFERVAEELPAARNTQRSGGPRSVSRRAQQRARSAMEGVGEGGKPA
jgi:hypothetical protein